MHECMRAAILVLQTGRCFFKLACPKALAQLHSGPGPLASRSTNAGSAGARPQESRELMSDICCNADRMRFNSAVQPSNWAQTLQSALHAAPDHLGTGAMTPSAHALQGLCRACALGSSY